MATVEDLKDPKKRAEAVELEELVYDIRAEGLARHKAKKNAQRTAPLVYDGEETLKSISWLVDGLLPAEGAGMLFAESDIGKTFVAVDIGVHIASNKAWLGRYAVKQGTVLFIEAEGGPSFALRKHAAKGNAGLGDQLGPSDELPFMKLPFITLYQSLGIGPDTDLALLLSYATLIRNDAAKRDLPPIRIVVVDTLAQNMAGDADSNDDMGAFLRAFRAFLKALSDEPVFGLLIHHPGHRDKTRGRGAYSLGADLDLIMQIENNPKARHALTLQCTRMRDGERFSDINIQLDRRLLTVDGEPLKDDKGRNQYSLVVRPRECSADVGERTEEELAAAAEELAKVAAAEQKAALEKQEIEAALAAVRELIPHAKKPPTANEVEKALLQDGAHKRESIRKAILHGLALGVLVKEPGAGKSGGAALRLASPHVDEAAE